MELLAPSALWWLGLLGPLALLYVLKRKREVRTVGSTWLWELARRDLRAERPWKRLVPHLSLVLQALVLVLGAVALARPVGGVRVPEGARLAVVIDTSASMAAREPDGSSRLELARRTALALARSLPPGGSMMLVDARAEPVVLAPPTADPAALERALDALAVRGESAGLEAAVAVASERLRDGPSGSRIVVLTDGAEDAEIVLPASPPVEIRAVGTDRPNAGLVACDVRARPTPEAPDRADVFARVAAYGQPAELWVLASVEGRGLVASRRVRVEPGSAQSVVMGADLPPDASGRGAVVRVELARAEEGTGQGTGDALALDDVAVAPSPGARRLPVFLVGQAPRSLERALLADRNVELFATSLEGLADRAADPSSGELDGLLVYAGRAPPVISGDALVVAPTEDSVLGVRLGPEASRPRIVSWDEADPRLRFVSLAEVHLTAARPFASAALRPLVTADAGVVAGVLERPDGEATILSFDPDRSDWPRGAGFVVFVRNLLERARARRAAGGIPPGALGEPLRVPAADGETVRATAPDGSTRSAVGHGGVALVEVPALPGSYAVEVGRRHLWALRSLGSPAQSDLSSRARFVERESGATVTGTTAREPLEAWPWLAALLLLALAAEVAWATRKGAAA